MIHENFKESQITLVCSKHNYQVAKNYTFIRNLFFLREIAIPQAIDNP